MRHVPTATGGLESSAVLLVRRTAREASPVSDEIDQILAHLGEVQRDMAIMTDILERLGKLTVEHSRRLAALEQRGQPPRVRHRIVRQGR